MLPLFIFVCEHTHALYFLFLNTFSRAFNGILPCSLCWTLCLLPKRFRTVTSPIMYKASYPLWFLHVSLSTPYGSNMDHFCIVSSFRFMSWHEFVWVWRCLKAWARSMTNMFVIMPNSKIRPVYMNVKATAWWKKLAALFYAQKLLISPFMWQCNKE